MQKISAWMFLIIALMMLLPMIGVLALDPIGEWITLIAYIAVGVTELKK